MNDSKDIALPARFIHQTTRYVLGRMTYAVSEHTQWLVNNWHRIPDAEKHLIRRDVEMEFARHDSSREDDPDYISPLGMHMDVHEWRKVRMLWAMEPTDE